MDLAAALAALDAVPALSLGQEPTPLEELARLRAALPARRASWSSATTRSASASAATRCASCAWWLPARSPRARMRC
jgi:hypothetical protein